MLVRTIFLLAAICPVLGLLAPQRSHAQTTRLPSPSQSWEGESWQGAHTPEVAPASYFLQNSDGVVEPDATPFDEDPEMIPDAPPTIDVNPAVAAAAAPEYPTVKLSGVFQADAGWFSQDEASYQTFGRIQDGTDFRRARLAAGGHLTPDMSYFFQMDFAFFGRPTFTDVWVAFHDVPCFGNIKVGQWKQPFSLEVVSSFRYTTFMERSVLFQPFTPFRRMGIGFYDWSEDLSTTWAASAVRTGQDQYGGTLTSDGGYGAVGRITHLLWYDECEGSHYLHLGGGYYLNAPPHDVHRLRTIPEFFVGENGPGAVGTSGQAVPGPLNGTPFFVDTGAFPADLVNTFGTELLWVAGPLSVQSEAMVAMVDRPNNSSVTFPGGYVQVGYFLTGEHRPYDRKAGAIDRVIPFHDFNWTGGLDGCAYGPGAWEVAARLSHIDLNDDDINGGRLTDFTFGVNWYMNPNTKVVFNYILASLEPGVDNPLANAAAGHSYTSIYGARMQIDF